jgi:glycosyltransferase involved in cell wall biosynthesis
LKVSVIIPNYNHSQYLEQRIESILNQTYTDFELIILDDYSTDNSRNIIDEYTTRFPDIKSFFNSINTGNPFKQWDYGVSLAKGQFIWIAESDDFASPYYLEKAVEIMEEDEKRGIVYCDSKVLDEQKKTEYLISEKKTFFSKRKWLNNYSNNGYCEIHEHLYLANMINNVSSVLFRKSKYIEAGLADHAMKYCGDWFLYIRILLISDVAYISEPLNSFRLHASSSFNYYFSSNDFLKEVLKIYSFVLKHIKLSLKKKLLMIVYLLRIFVKRQIHSVKNFYLLR